MTTEQTLGHGIVDGKKEQLVNDLKAVVADVNGLMREMADSTAEGFSAARTKVEGRLDAARAKVGNARTAVAERTRNVAAAGQGYVTENPWKTLGVGVAAGLVVGFLMRRR